MPGDKVTCGICGRPREHSEVTIFTLTPEERKRFGAHAPTEIAQCRPCRKLMLEPEMALQVMKGLAQVTLQRMGMNVGDAEKAAKKYKNDLLAKMKIPRKP